MTGCFFLSSSLLGSGFMEVFITTINITSSISLELLHHHHHQVITALVSVNGERCNTSIFSECVCVCTEDNTQHHRSSPTFHKHITPGRTFTLPQGSRPSQRDRHMFVCLFATRRFTVAPGNTSGTNMLHSVTEETWLILQPVRC